MYTIKDETIVDYCKARFLSSGVNGYRQTFFCLVEKEKGHRVLFPLVNSGYLLSSCKAYQDEVIFCYNTGKVSGEVPIKNLNDVWITTSPRLLVYTLREDVFKLRHEIVEKLNEISKQIGIKAPIMINETDVPGAWCLKLPRAWVSSSHMFSLLTWIIRAYADNVLCNGSIFVGKFDSGLFNDYMMGVSFKQYHSVIRDFKEKGLPAQIEINQSNSIHDCGFQRFCNPMTYYTDGYKDGKYKVIQ